MHTSLQDEEVHDIIDDTGEDIPTAAEVLKYRHRELELATAAEDEALPDLVKKYVDERYGKGAKAYAVGE